jgi:cytochrome P450
VSLIGNAVLALLRHPDQLAALCAEPALVPNAVEELVRYDGPVERTLNRWAATDVELRGHTIRRGQSVIVILGSANRDPERFSDADRLDVTKEADSRHLGFGRGSHYCLGAPLARLEAEIALTTLLQRLPGLRLAIDENDLAWRPLPLFRSLAALPVAWDV